MEFLKSEKRLHKKYVLMLLLQFRDIIEKLPTIVELDIKE